MHSPEKTSGMPSGADAPAVGAQPPRAGFTALKSLKLAQGIEKGSSR